jgi:hypothetical protein
MTRDQAAAGVPHPSPLVPLEISLPGRRKRKILLISGLISVISPVI